MTPPVETEKLARKLWRRPELPVLIVLLTMAAAILGFAALAEVVAKGSTQRFDLWVVESTRNPDNRRLPFGPPWLVEMGRDVTALGGVAVVSLVTLVAAGYLLLRRKPAAMGLMLLAVISGTIVSGLLKHLVARARPPLGSEIAATFTSSFPSGHSMLSAVAYLTLGAMLARAEPQWRLKIYVIGVAVLATFLVGVSRVYMGVHYPSDVLGGWAAGLFWALAWWLVARKVHQTAFAAGLDKPVADV